MLGGTAMQVTGGVGGAHLLEELLCPCSHRLEVGAWDAPSMATVRPTTTVIRRSRGEPFMTTVRTGSSTTPILTSDRSRAIVSALAPTAKPPISLRPSAVGPWVVADLT